MNAIDICRKAIVHYGAQSQIMVFLGELAELSQAITASNRSAIVEELADVQVCLATRFIIAGIEPDLSKVPRVTGGFFDIFTEIALQEARLVQGRSWQPLALYCLSGWIDKIVHDFKAEDEIEKIKVFKLKRLMRRIESEKVNLGA